jgi:hypothetical protein
LGRRASIQLGGALTDDQDAVGDAALLEFFHRVGEDVEALFHHQAAQEADGDLIVGNAQRAAPGHVAALGVEDLAVDAARP